MAGDTYTLSEVAAMSAPQSGGQSFTLEDVQKMTPSFAEQMLRRERAGLGTNLLRGVKDVIDTGAEGLAWLYDKATGGDQQTLSSLITGQKPQSEYERVKALNKAGREEFERNWGNDEILSRLQRLGGNALATAPVTSAIGAGTVAAGLPRLGAAISSGGMTAGQGLPFAANVATRAAGGAVNGGVSAGLVDPESGATGAVIGAVTPGALQMAGAATRAVREAVTNRGGVGLARKIADIAGVDSANPEAVQALRDALRQQGPQLIPGAEPTLPQILQVPGISQLQRSVKAAAPGALNLREAEQGAARMEALNRIAPVSGTVQQAAEDAGNSIASYAIPARQAATDKVSALFNSVDPFGETRFTLPIDAMRAAQSKYLGPGTFGSGRDARSAIKTAEDIGTQEVPGIKPLSARAAGSAQNLEQAVRELGGIKPDSYLGGEINTLRPKESGTTGLYSKNGKSADYMAQLMHERGYIEDPDPATLLDALRNGGGRSVYAYDAPEAAFQRMAEDAMGDAPGATRIAKPVSFDEVQNLRSSLNEGWSRARATGNAREAAALQQMIRDIDSRVKAVSEGHGPPGDFFAPDMVQTWREALKAHAAKKLQFDTGPQASIFRMGGDGMPQIQGAEIPGKFFSSSRSQVENAQAFRRLVNDDPQLLGDLQRYAVTDAANQTDRFGNLSNAKFNRWLDARSGATGVIFNDRQRATLKGIADDLRRADVAESLGRATGSDTAQKAASMMRLGLLDHPATALVASRIPYGSAALGLLSRPVMNARAEKLGGLLANPEEVAGLLDTYLGRQPQPTGLLQLATPLSYRGAPLLSIPPGYGGGN